MALLRLCCIRDHLGGFNAFLSIKPHVFFIFISEGSVKLTTLPFCYEYKLEPASKPLSGRCLSISAKAILVNMGPFVRYFLTISFNYSNHAMGAVCSD